MKVKVNSGVISLAKHLGRREMLVRSNKESDMCELVSVGSYG